MWISYALNSYGTPVSIHRCEDCNDIFTVCPAKEPEADGWEGCMALTCESYDVARDADKMFAQGKVKRRK